MKEFEFIKCIKDVIGNEYIGDDCAYIKDLSIVVTQDSLVENIHFKRDWCTPYQLGYKSAAVNISDILASGGIPGFLTISLSLPASINDSFINDFYKGASSCLNSVKIIGGDLTGSENDIYISICAIGSTNGRYISSRKNVKEDYIIITTGNYGSSALGLKQLQQGIKDTELIKIHLEPKLEYSFSESISKNVNVPYAMMDTSDGLADALFKLAETSNVKIVADYNSIPHITEATKEDVLFGGEDYKPVAAIPESYLKYVNDAVVIGRAYKYDGIRLDISGDIYNNYDDLNVYNHFN